MRKSLVALGLCLSLTLAACGPGAITPTPGPTPSPPPAPPPTHGAAAVPTTAPTALPAPTTAQATATTAAAAPTLTTAAPATSTAAPATATIGSNFPARSRSSTAAGGTGQLRGERHHPDRGATASSTPAASQAAISSAAGWRR